MTRDLQRIALSAGVLIALAGYGFVFRPMEATIAARYADIDTQRALMERDLAAARRMSPLAAQLKIVEAQLRRLHLHDSRAALVDRFLQAAADAAARNHVAIQTVVPSGSPTRETTASLLEEFHLDLTIRGSYGSALRTMRELGGADVAAELSLAALGNVDRREARQPQLNATFHVTLLRESDGIPNHVPRSV